MSIARAVYTDADIYILDDPLSAVDAHAGEHIFQECFRKQLRKKTRILVTNQLQFLPYTDRVYVMKGGRIVDAGTFAELNKKGWQLLYFPLTSSLLRTLRPVFRPYSEYYFLMFCLSRNTSIADHGSLWFDSSGNCHKI